VKNAKTIGLVVATVLLAIVVLQNTQATRTQILFFTIEMRNAVLLFLTLLCGFVLGLVAKRRIGRAEEPKGEPRA